MRVSALSYVTAFVAVACSFWFLKDVAAAQYEAIGTVDRKTYFAEQSFTTNWGEASRACNKTGMRLATITSAAQKALLDNSYDNETFERSYWLGAQDYLNTFDFLWDFNGENVNCSFACPISTHTQTCLYYNALQKYIRAFPCAEHRSTLCEFLHDI